MKQFEKILLYVLVIGMAGLYILHFTGSVSEDQQSGDMADTLAEADEPSKSGTIYYVNTDTVWDNYALVQETMRNLEGKKKSYEQQLESRLRDFESKVMDFRQKGATMSDVELQIKQRDLQRQESELADLKNNLEMKFLEEEQAWNDKIRTKIIKQITDITSDRTYDYILGYSISSNILVANDSLDLTREVLDALNAQYATSQNTK